VNSGTASRTDPICNAMCPTEPSPNFPGLASSAASYHDLSDWMAELADDWPLAAISMPGTHNSASYAVTRHISAIVAASRCQAFDLESQLHAGVRFLDLRVRGDGTLCHGPVTCDLTLQGALEVCRDFLQVHSKEVVIARIKDEAASKTSAQDVDALVNDLVDSAAFPLYLQMRLPKLQEVRGRIVVLCDWAGGQLGLRWAGPAMRIQDQYWHKTGTKKWSVVRKQLLCALPSQDCLCIHFTSATALPRKMPITLARSVNPKFSDYLRSSSGRRFLGIVAMDFPSRSLCELIVQHNWRGLDPCRSLQCSNQTDPRSHEWFEDLRCELMAAASRADAASLTHHDEVFERVRWLGHVFTKVLLARVEVEVCEPAVLEPALQPADSKASSAGAPPAEDAVLHETSKDSVSSATPRKGILGRVSSRFRSSPCNKSGNRTADDGLGSTTSTMCAAAEPSGTAVVDADWLENMQCELLAAASRADAAALQHPEDVPMRVQWLARVYVCLLVERTQVFEAEGIEAVARMSSSDSDDDRLGTTSAEEASAKERDCSVQHDSGEQFANASRAGKPRQGRFRRLLSAAARCTMKSVL